MVNFKDGRDEHLARVAWFKRSSKTLNRPIRRSGLRRKATTFPSRLQLETRLTVFEDPRMNLGGSNSKTDGSTENGDDSVTKGLVFLDGQI
jgi:hypothetical protein